jgi:archaellum component FlaG (FlaF/FlaG flagellin family)
MEFLARRFTSFRLLNWRMAGCLGGLLAAIVVFGVVSPAAMAAEQTDTVIALRLADMLRSARSVISQYQKLINDPEKGDKGLTGERVLTETIAIYQKQTGEDPLATDPNSKEGRLLRAQMDAIKEVVDENQHTINAPGVGFKGFIPAVFARLVNEKFAASVGQEAVVKVTAPEDLIRNRKARPDAWETSVITDKFANPDWKKGTPFSETTTVDSRAAFRLIVPEYYAQSCLACHGEPKGETDITGYPKEGGKEGDLGAAISITLFQ